MPDSSPVRFARIEKSLDYIQRTVDDIDKKLELDYVTKSDAKLMQRDIEQLKQIVFGFVGLVLIAFAGSLIAVFIRR